MMARTLTWFYLVQAESLPDDSNVTPQWGVRNLGKIHVY